MSKTFPFIDSDAHVLEPRDMFERYLEPKYRARMPVAWADYQVTGCEFYQAPESVEGEGENAI